MTNSMVWMGAPLIYHSIRALLKAGGKSTRSSHPTHAWLRHIRVDDVLAFFNQIIVPLSVYA